MSDASNSNPRLDQVVLLLFGALFLLLSPLRDWWAADDALWYAPYLVWVLIILVSAWRAHSGDRT